MNNTRISRQEAEDAVRIILRYIGENPEDKRLIETPKRVVDSCNQLFSGYNKSLEEILHDDKTMQAFSAEPIILKNIQFHSICEHHLLPFSGTITVCYKPSSTIIGVGRIKKVIDFFSRRIQIQERLTSEICEAIYNSDFKPDGVGIAIEAKHCCMYMRDPASTESILTTHHFCGSFQNEASKQYFMMI